MEVALAQEKIWFDKYKYEEAEKLYFENLAKLLISDGYSNKKTETPKVPAPCPPVSAPLKDNVVISILDPISHVTPSEPPLIENKRFKAKDHNKSKKDAEKKVEKPHKQDLKVSSNNAIMKNSLAEEVAKARQHIKNSLECVDGIAKLTSDNIAVEITNRINSLESENINLKKDVKDLTDVVKKLSDRISALEKSGGASVAKPVASSKPAATKPKVEEDDDGVDLFGSDSEEEDEEAKKVKEQRLAEYAARKSKKPVLIAKSNIILDVKPWDDETDMKKMEVEVRKVTTDGLIWGASKLVPLAYGIHKLQISCVVEDDKVSVDWLQEQLESIEDYVQSVDIAAFNKV